MVCSQYRRCQIPFSRLLALLANRGFGSRPREKLLLIKLQRVEKSASPSAPKWHEGDRAGRRSRWFQAGDVVEPLDRLDGGDQSHPREVRSAVRPERP